MFDYVVYIGRFQPFHNGHKYVVNEAKKLARKKVIVLVGSAWTPRNIKNPFTYIERAIMINGSFPDVVIDGLSDYRYNDMQWVMQVQETVNKIVSAGGGGTVALIGLDKDRSTEYLNWFPQWEFVNVRPFGDGDRYDATAIRNLLFSGHNVDFISGVVPASTMGVITNTLPEEAKKNLMDEYEFVRSYKKSWEAAPYAPTFVTGDAVVFQSGHVLLVKRGANPGKGLWALPGGFLNQEERIIDGVIRELREETKLKVPDPVLRGSIVGSGVFDSPDRSLRGRTITHAYAFKLAEMGKLPIVKGSDDAVRAKWVPISDVREDMMFEDHFDIINFFKGML